MFDQAASVIRVQRGIYAELRASIYLVMTALLGAIALAPSDRAYAGTLVVQEVKPSDTDSAITRFNEPNYVVFDGESTADADLVIFLPGTAGKPSNVARLLGVVATQGYRVVGLEYNDVPAVIQVCPQNSLASCSATFRQRRVFGGDVKSVVENTQAESIVNRLAKLLAYLQGHDPPRHWGDYLTGDEPNWSRIVVSGLSQGAGMAAYIAKQKAVARVVLFSSPWDFQRSSKQLAPWLIEPSATPRERWFAEYHRRENTASLIARAYQALQIPTSNIKVFDLDLPGNMRFTKDNPYHGSTVSVPAYAPEWVFLFGRSR